MSIHQKRSQGLDDQDKSRRLVFSPLTRARFCARNRARPGRPAHWKEKLRPDSVSAFLQPMCRRARRSPQSPFGEAGEEYFVLCRNRMRQFESGPAAEFVYLLRPAIFGSTMAR